MKRPMDQSRAGIGIDCIAWRTKPWGKTQYVGSLPGDGGKDWGWTDDLARAMHLKPYWQRRFRASMRACGIPFQAQPIPADEKPVNVPSQQEQEAALENLPIVTREEMAARKVIALATPD